MKGEALRPPRTPSRLYLHSIHPPIHASINGVPTNRPTNQAPKRPNQQTKQPANKETEPLFSPTCRRYLVCVAGEALRPPPHPCIYRASTHPSNHQTSKQKKSHIHHCFTQPINIKQANQPTRQKEIRAEGAEGVLDPLGNRANLLNRS